MTTRIASGQQIVRFASDAIEFAHMMSEAALSAIAELSGSQFKDEEVSSNYGYPPEYTGPEPIAEQVDRLASLFDLSVGGTAAFIEIETLCSWALPEGAEGWFAIPKVDAIASRFFPEVKDPGERYCRAVSLVLGKIGESRMFNNFSEDDITPAYLRQHARTASMLERIAAEQPGDILVIPAQFGLRHRGKSERRARVTLRRDEFGLGALAVGSMLLTHPNRLVRSEQLHVDCAGDEFAPVTEGQLVRVPNFHWRDNGLVRFGSGAGYNPCDRHGSASGFLPQ